MAILLAFLLALGVPLPPPLQIMGTSHRKVFGGGGGGGISFVAAASNETGACASNPSVALSTSAGDTLVIAQGWSGGATGLGAPTGTGGDTVTAGVGSTPSLWTGTNAGRIDVIKQTSANGSYVVTGNMTNVNALCNLIVAQLRGSATGNIDITAVNQMGNSPSSTSTCVPSTTSNTSCDSTFTPTVSGEASFLFMTNTTASTAGSICGSSATIPTNGQSTHGAMEYRLSSGTSACTATMSFTSATQGVALVITIKP